MDFLSNQNFILIENLNEEIKKLGLKILKNGLKHRSTSTLHIFELISHVKSNESAEF